MKKRMKKKISAFLALVLVLQCFCTTNLFADEIGPAAETPAVSVSSEAPAAESEAPTGENSEPGNGSQTGTVSDVAAVPESGNASEPAAGNGEAPENSASSDTVPADTPSENAVSEDSASGNTVSANTEEESAGETQEEKAVTVMLYQVGCDLERNSLAARKDLSEIMDGINTRVSANILAPSINFVVETGGMKNENLDDYNSMVDSESSSGNLKILKDASFNDKLGDPHKFGYTENQRWVISGNNITAAKTQPSYPTRAMNASEEGINKELLEFINTTTEDYPAKQYVLIFWDHGGGSNGGCGNDERGDGSITSSQIRATMPETTVFGKNKKQLAWIGYDACLMANLETALVWKPYARFFSGSEELEGNDGWDYTGWVTELCNAASLSENNFSDENMNTIIGDKENGVGPKAVADFVAHYTEGNATQTFVDLRKIDAAATAFEAYSNKFLDLFTAYPIDTYRAIRFIRNAAQSFMGTNPPLADIRDLTIKTDEMLRKELEAMGLTKDELEKYYLPVTTQGDELRKAIKDAVVSENHTDDYGELGGLTVFFPYASNGAKDLTSYRSMYDPEAKLDPYLDLLGLYYSVRNAGDDLCVNNKTLADIDSLFKKSLSDYKVSDKLGSGKISSVPSELIAHRIQNEAIKIKKDNMKYSLVRRDFTLFNTFDQHLVLEKDKDKLYLGYLPAGNFEENKTDNVWEQDLYNYDAENWFGVVVDNDKKLPAALYYVDVISGANALNGKVDIMVPVLDKDNNIYILDVSFDEGQAKGKLNGMWPYTYEYNQFGRYIYNKDENVKSKMPFRLLGNVLESTENRTDIEFDGENPDNYVYGEIPAAALFNDDQGFYRNIDEFKGGDYDSSFISNELKDIFDSPYFYGDNPSYRQELKVSVELSDEVSAITKGSDLKKSDLQIVLRNSAGESVHYTLSSDYTGSDTLYYMKDENGEKITLTTKEGILYKQEEPLKVTENIDIYLDEMALSANSAYAEIDLATESLADSFSLEFAEGKDSVTVQVYDPESDQLSITPLSTPLYYLSNYKTPLSTNNYADYFKVTVGNIDVTKDKTFTDKVTFSTKKEGSSSWSSWKKGSLDKDLKPGTQIAVQIIYDDSLSANNVDNPVVVKKSPAKIMGTKPVSTNRLQALQAEYNGPIEVKYYDAKNKEISGVPDKFNYTILSRITKDSSAKIDTKGIDNTISGSYIDLPLSVKTEWNSDFTDLFEVKEFVLSKYVIHNVSTVQFLSSTDRKQLCGTVSIRSDSASKEGRISVSKGSVPITGTTPVEWYYKAGSAYPVVVYRGNAPVKYGKLDLVEKNSKGEWSFYIPDNLNGEDVIFYAGYAPEAKNEGDIEVKIDPITPVEYTGRNIVTTKSTKSGSKLLGLVIRSNDGAVELVENVDYSVSYKNNKNVSDIYDRKPPTIIVKGKNAYKGLKYTINFTILPADFANATITVDRRYAPINSNKKKGVTLVATVKLPGGSKVPSNRYDLHFFTRDEKGLRTEVTRSELASYYKTDKVYPLFVSATAKQPADQGTNFVTGSRIDPSKEAFVYAYPKTTSKVSVTLRTKKFEYTEKGKNVDEIFSVSNLKALKAGGKPISIGQIEQPVVAYYDKKLTEPVYSDVLKDAGTYYLCAALTDTAKAQYRVFNSTPVQVTITGTKLKRSNIALMDTKIVAVSGNAREPESLPLLLRFASDFEWNTLLVRCTQRDGGTVDYWINKDDKNCYEESGMRYYKLLGVDNGAIGNYKVTVYGAEEYSGSVTYSYKVVAK